MPKLTWTFLLAAMLAGPTVALADPPRRGPPSDERRERKEERMERVMEREAELLDLVREHAPERIQTLEVLRRDDPVAYRRTLMKLARVVRDSDGDEATIARKLEMKSTEMAIRERAEGFEDLSNAEQKGARAEIEELAEQLFELRQADRRAKLERLEARLEELRQEIDEREGDRDALLEDFVDQVIRGRVDL